MESGTASFEIAMVAAGALGSSRGSQALIRSVATGLRDRGHQVHAVTYPESEVSDELDPQLGQLTWLGRRIRSDVKLAVALWRLLRSRSIDVIHAHNYEGYLIALLVGRWFGTPIVYHAHNILTDELPYYVRSRVGRRIASAFASVVDRKLPKIAHHVVALTREQFDFLEQRGVRRESMSLVRPQLVALEKGNSTIRATGREADEEFVVAYAGNLDSYQNIELLLDGFQRFRRLVPHASLELFLSSRLKISREIETLFSRAGVITRFVDPSLEGNYLAGADLLVCPRTSWSGFSIKLINYMDAGKPIVVSDGSAGVIENGRTGLVFQRDDPESLSESLYRLYRNPRLRRNLGQAARLAAREFHDVEGSARRFEGIYADLVVAKRRAWRKLTAAMFQGLIGIPLERISAPCVGKPAVS